MKYFVCILVVVLLGIPKISGNLLFQFIPIALMVAAIFSLVHVVNIRSVKISRALLLFVLITAIALIRNNNPNTNVTASVYRVIELLLFVFCVILFYCWFKKKKIDTQKILVFGIVLPFTIYCLINILFWWLEVKFAGQEELVIGKCVLLGYVGLDIERVQFPFGSGINSFATVVGSVLALALALLYFSKKNRLLVFFCIIVFTIVLALTDSRSSLFYPVIAVVLVKLFRFFKLRKSLAILPYVPLIAPLILLLVIQLLQDLDLVSSISRETEEIASANGRQVIWGISLIELIDFQFIHLIGYGQFGHYASGASKLWGFMFSRWKNGDLTHPHNTIFMVIFDYGYLGLLILVLMFRSIVAKITKISDIDDVVSKVILTFFLYILMITTTESYLGMYYMNALYLFILVILVLYINNYPTEKEA